MRLGGKRIGKRKRKSREWIIVKMILFGVYFFVFFMFLFLVFIKEC